MVNPYLAGKTPYISLGLTLLIPIAVTTYAKMKLGSYVHLNLFMDVLD